MKKVSTFTEVQKWVNELVKWQKKGYVTTPIYDVRSLQIGFAITKTGLKKDNIIYSITYHALREHPYAEFKGKLIPLHPIMQQETAPNRTLSPIFFDSVGEYSTLEILWKMNCEKVQQIINRQLTIINVGR